MIEIELNNIKKNYGIKNILNGFSLEIKSGEKVALIGQNGCGKSTLLKIISGMENVNSGDIHIRNGATIQMLNQIYENEKEDVCVRDFLNKAFEELFRISSKLRELEEKMSVPENENMLDKILKEYGRLQDKYTLLGGYDIEENMSKICSMLHISDNMLNQKYNFLSGGEKTRVNLALILLKKPDILLLDEPTNHLDIDSLEFLEDIVLKYKGTVVIVSHDRYFLDKVVNKTVLLEDGKANIYLGNYSYFLEEDERRTLAKFENYKNQQKQIEKMKESIETLRKFGNLAMNEMFFKRAKSIEKRLEKMEVLDKVSLDKNSIDLSFKMKDRSGKDVLRAKDLEKSFGEKQIFKKSSFLISYSDKVALVGKNGTGKSTLLHMILGEDKDYTGELILGTGIKMGYIPQNIVFEDKNMTVLDFFLKDNAHTQTDSRKKLAKYGFRGESVFKRIGTLSGGEKVRLLLIKLVQKDVNFLILDEPTNHIDIDTREILEESLETFPGTVLFVSHDRFFINKLATKVLSIKDNKLNIYYGNYDNVKNII